MLTPHTSPRWFACIAVQLECVLTEEESPQVQMLLETRDESPRFAAFKTNEKNLLKCSFLTGI